MTQTMHDDWILDNAIPFSTASPETFDVAVDQMIASLGDSVELLGFGEALHGGEAILQLRNRLFQHLVKKHGYSAIAVESSFPKGRLVDEYVAGRGPASYDGVQEAGFSHGFGRLGANRELVEWMRGYNADPSHPVQLRFYGFDSPTEMTGSDSPRRLLEFVLAYLASVDRDAAQEYRNRIEALLGPDAGWENPAAMMDPAQSVGRSPAATALRIATEDLITELHVRRPELVTKNGGDRYREAMQHSTVARWLLNYHAAVATPGSTERIVRLLGMRDAMMADNLTSMAAREQGRGKVLAFAHNSHLRRGQAEWQLGPHALAWWTAGAHLDAIMGLRYAVVGSAVGVSEENGIGRPEPGTLEALLAAVAGTGLFLPAPDSEGLVAEIASLPARSGSRKNSTYFPLTPHTITDFDCLVFVGETGYARGGPPLPKQDGGTG